MALALPGPMSLASVLIECISCKLRSFIASKIRIDGG